MNEHCFETISKAAYTHGFESIYALENVDLRSVRPFQNYVSSSPPIALKNIPRESFKEEKQYVFDFGIGFRNWIEPFFLYEPIFILELSKFAEKILEQNNIIYIKDLLQPIYKNVISRGLGKGYVDEIQEKLNTYLINKNVKKSVKIDFASMLRAIFAGISKKKAYIFLQKYDLQDLIFLLPSENIELKKLSENKCREWLDDISEVLMTSSKVQFIQKKIQEIALDLYIPWLEKRSGYASLWELLEFMQLLSMDSSLTEKSLIFLSEIYFSRSFPLNSHLIQPMENIYTIDTYHSKVFHQIQSKALSYFYSPSIIYSLDQLIEWVLREFAKQWQNVTKHTVMKVLTLSPIFYIWKDREGHKEIKLF